MFEIKVSLSKIKIVFREKPLSDNQVTRLLALEEKRQLKALQEVEIEGQENESLKPAKKGKFEKKPPGTIDISAFFVAKK